MSINFTTIPNLNDICFHVWFSSNNLPKLTKFSPCLGNVVMPHGKDEPKQGYLQHGICFDNLRKQLNIVHILRILFLYYLPDTMQSWQRSHLTHLRFEHFHLKTVPSFSLALDSNKQTKRNLCWELNRKWGHFSVLLQLVSQRKKRDWVVKFL